MDLTVTTLSASLLAAVLVALSWRVIRHRQTGGVSLGGGDDVQLQRAIRAQANLVEYAPIFLIMLALAELQGGSLLLLSVLAMIFVLGRVIHGYALAFSDSFPAGRVSGMVMTLSTLSILAIYNLTFVV